MKKGNTRTKVILCVQIIYAALLLNLESIHATRIITEPNSTVSFANAKGKSYRTIDGFDCYRTVQGCQDTMADLAFQYGFFVEVKKIGDSWVQINGGEPDYGPRVGSDITVIILKNQFSPKAKSPIFIVCNMIPVELSPPEMCARFAEKITQDARTNGDFNWMLDYTEIHMIFHANPDGRNLQEEDLSIGIYKNRHYSRPCEESSQHQIGVNINNNFPHTSWGEGQSTNQCSVNYSGQSGLSELETNAIVDHISSEMSNFDSNIKGVVLDLHSTGQEILWPQLSDNNPASDPISDYQAHWALAKKIGNNTKPNFISNNGRNPVRSGTLVDWAYETFGLASLYIGIGTDNFEECANIDKLYNNAQEAILYAIRTARDPFTYPLGPEIKMISPLDVYPQTPFFRIFVEVFDESDDISSINLYMDNHPYDEGVSADVTETGFTSSKVSTVLQLPSVLTIGQHTVYLQAQDVNGPGPVYAHRFRVSDDATYNPTSTPTSASPTISPIVSITFPPSRKAAESNPCRFRERLGVFYKSINRAFD